MLKKLIKYDLKFIFKILIIFYGLAIVFAGLARLCTEFQTNAEILKILGILFSALLYGVWGNILVHTFIRTLLRFKQNFYGKESYITHTLPVKKSTQLASKFISSLIVIVSSCVCLFVSIVIMFYSKSNMQMLSLMLSSKVQGLSISSSVFVMLIAFVVLTQICLIMSAVATSVVLGYRKNDHKKLFSTLYGFGFYFATLISILVCSVIGCAIMGDAGALFSNAVSGNILIMMICVCIVVESLFAVGFYFLCKHEFEKGVNVE